MAEDLKDGLALAEKLLGREMSPDELAADFARLNVVDRATALRDLQKSTPDDMSPREAAKHLLYIRSINAMHERLRKVGR